MTERPAPAVFAPLAAVRAQAAAAGIFLDIDGVLAAIRPRPEDAFVPPETRLLLEALSESFRVVAAVSGRSLADAEAMVGVPGLVVVGNHGMEAAGPGWREEWASAEERRRVAAAAESLRLDPHLDEAGVQLELKGFSLSLHYRRSPNQEAAAAVALRAAEAAAERHGLQALAGRAVVDLRPSGPNKGTAVRRLVDREGLCAAAYLGDDRTDLDAFRALRALREGGMETVNVAVTSEEVPPALEEAADVVVAFAEVPRLFAYLLA